MSLETFLSAGMQDTNLHYVADGLLLQYKPEGCADVPSIFLAATAYTFMSVAELALPLLIATGVGFTLPSSQQAARRLDLSLSAVCPALLSVSVTPDLNVALLCRHLVELTKDMEGPRIYHRVYLGGVVYAEPRLVKKFGLPKGQLTLPASGWIGGCYGLRLLKDDRKGRIFKALSFSGGLPHWVLLKEGRAHLWEDETGKDMRTRIDWQYRIGCQLSGVVNIARPIKVFSHEENRFLVTDFIEGESLHQLVLSTYRGRSWRDFSEGDRHRLLSFFAKACRQVEILHSAGVIHRDLTTSNFIMDETGRVFLLDLELSYSISERFPTPAFGMGTPGYMSVGQIGGNVPVAGDDIYSLGACLKVILTGLPPDCVTGGDMAQHLTWISGEQFLSELAAACCDANPAVRPSLAKIAASVEQRGHAGRGLLEQPAVVSARQLRQRLEEWVADSRFGRGLSPAVGKKVPAVKPVVDLLHYHGSSSILMILAKLQQAGGSLKDSNALLERTVLTGVESLRMRELSGHSSPKNVHAAMALVCALEAGLVAETVEIRSLLIAYFSDLPSLPELQDQLVIGQGLMRCTSFLPDGLVAGKLADLPVTSLGGKSLKSPQNGHLQMLGRLLYFQGCLRRQYPDMVRGDLYQRQVRQYTARLKKHVKKGVVAPGLLRPLLVAGQCPARESISEWMRSLPDHLMLVNWSLENGMAGYGRLFLEAGCYGVDGDWQRPATWIAGMLCRLSVPVVEANQGMSPGRQYAVCPDRYFSEEAGSMYFLALYLLVAGGGGSPDVLIP